MTSWKSDGKGKYALIRLRNTPTDSTALAQVQNAFGVLNSFDMLDMGLFGTKNEFVVLRIRDKYAPAALSAYLDGIRTEGVPEFVAALEDMLAHSGPNSPYYEPAADEDMSGP